MTTRKAHHLVGFCLGFTADLARNNRFSDDYTFDPHFPFAGNEDEFLRRMKMRGGSCRVVGGCFVEHYNNTAWAPQEWTLPDPHHAS